MNRIEQTRTIARYVNDPRATSTTQRHSTSFSFEEHRPFPTDVTTWLEEHGYTLFRIARPLLGPKLRDPRVPFERVDWLPVSLVATSDPHRAKARFTPIGWSSLRRSRTT